MDILAVIVGVIFIIVGRKRQTQTKKVLFIVGIILAVVGLIPFFTGFFGGFSSGFSEGFQEGLQR